MPSKIIARTDKENVVNFYKSRPMTYEEVGAEFGLSLPTIGKILKEYRIKPYSKVQLFSPNLREDYFENIDTEQKAYFLGLIITDGCVYSKNSRQNLVSLTLNEKDEYLLKIFKQELKSNKVITHDGRGASSINILSNKIVDSLRQYGIHDNKSLSTVFPNNLNLDMYPHLIRGILDGGGSISYYSRPNRKSHVKAIRFCQGNEKFLKDLVDFLFKYTGAEPVNLYAEGDSLWSIAYRKNESILKIFHYLYDDATIYMKRKKDLCDKVISEIVYYHGSTEITK